ncbi:MAG: four helix bundle protein [bacterium]|nr:four helix bundle protein [bacterium]
MQDFKDLKVWQRAHDLTLGVYQATRTFPREETYALTSQLRRSASSVAANIAEACGRDGSAEFGRFLKVAMGSASETEYHLILARDLEYMKRDAWEKLNAHTIEVKKMLSALILKLRTDD